MINIVNLLFFISPSDSCSRERFHPFTPGQHLTYRIPPINPDWYTKYNPELKIGACERA